MVFEETNMFGGFGIPIRPNELRLSMFVNEFYIGQNKYIIYGEYTNNLERFCYSILDKMRHIRFDIGLRSNIKSLMYYNVYFQHKINFICKNVNQRRPVMSIGGENYNTDKNFVVMTYFDYKAAGHSNYEDFIISHICIIRNKLGPSSYIQRDEDMNRVLKVNWNADRSGLFMEKCDKLYSIASIRLKHPILTVDNYEKIDNLSELLYDD